MQLGFRALSGIASRDDRSLGTKICSCARHTCAGAEQDRGMEILHAVAAALAPPLCAACGRSCRPEAVICTRCARRLAAAEPLLGKGPPGLDRAWSSAPHEGVAREPGRGAEVPPPAAGRRPDGGPDPVAGAGAHAERRDRAGAAGAARGCAAAASTRPASWRRRWPSGSTRRSSPAWRAAAAAGRSAAAAPSGSASRRGSRPPAPPRAASSSSTTCSPPGRR